MPEVRITELPRDSMARDLSKYDHFGNITALTKGRLQATLRKPLFVAVLIAVLVAASLPNVATPAYAQSPSDGEAVFEANCAACHSTGSDRILGPGLEGLSDRAGSTVAGQTADEYIRESINNPGAFLADGFLDLMPAIFEGTLTATELDNLVAYLDTLGGAGAPVPVLISAEVPAGDAERGQNLFTGPTRFENKGPSCSACHSSSGLGALGGGSLGPDLTGAYAKLGDAMILWPETSKTMKPIFTDRPLTEAEKADLLAFFKSADIAERDTQQVAQLFGLAVAGMAIIALLTHLIWRRRLGSVRKRMVGTPRLTSSKSSDKTTLVLSAFMVIMAGSIASGLTVIVVTVI